jgi:hypothetical protein
MTMAQQLQRQSNNFRFGLGLVLFIVVYFIATVCFIILE